MLQPRLRMMCTVGVLGEMSVPVQAIGSTLFCVSPPWGSKYAASSLSRVTENVTEHKLSVVTSVLLFDNEDKISRHSPYLTANIPWDFLMLATRYMCQVISSSLLLGLRSSCMYLCIRAFVCMRVCVCSVCLGPSKQFTWSGYSSQRRFCTQAFHRWFR